MALHQHDKHSHPSLTVIPGEGQSDQFDPWHFDAKEEYSRDEFYTRSVDKRGHKDTLHTPVLPSMMGMLGDLVASKHFPQYRTVHDVVRNALYHQLRYDAERIQDGAMSRQLDLELIANRKERRIEQVAQMERNLEAARSLFEKCEQLGYWDGLAEAVEETDREIEGLPEPFRGKTRGLVTRYKEVLSKRLGE